MKAVLRIALCSRQLHELAMPTHAAALNVVHVCVACLYSRMQLLGWAVGLDWTHSNDRWHRWRQLYKAVPSYGAGGGATAPPEKLGSEYNNILFVHSS